MPGSVRRRLATVLFLDIVGSTALATSLGDARWRELLTRFRRVVRAELKRRGGREQDTAGDGFFATFAEPAQALRAAASIAVAVQGLGIDVRGGVHTGECEQIDGKLGGIAVHIGSRVTALAGPAEVMVTGTVKDLAAGSGASFEEWGMHELKGIQGRWLVFSLRVAETSLPAPLSPDEAAARLALLAAPTRSWRRFRARFALAAVAVVAAGVAVPLLALRGGAAGTAAPISLVRLDTRTGHVGEVTHAGPLSGGRWANLWSVDGTLWQLIGKQHSRLVARSLATGRVKQTLPLPDAVCGCQIAFGFGSVWLFRTGVVVSGPKAGTLQASVERLDELSGRRLKTIQLSGNVDSGTIAIGNDAVWVLESDATLIRLDPLTNRVVASYATGAVETQTLIPLAGYEWICECAVNKVMRFDPRTHKSRTYSIPEQAYLIGVDTSQGRTLWLLDPKGATLTPMNPVNGQTGQPLGLSGQPEDAVIAFGAIWAAAGTVIDRVDLQTRQRTTIAMPHRVWAGSIAADPASGSLWIGNSLSAPGS